MGLPINKLIIATNKNDILKRVVNTGIYKPMETEHTISPSMDIQIASNFERLIFDISSNSAEKTLKLMTDLNVKGEFKLGSEELKKIKENFSSESLSDNETKLIISDFYKDKKIFIDPHTAVGIGAMEKLSLKEKTIVLATAHPSKFSEVVKQETKAIPELPRDLENILTKEEKYEKFPKDLKKIKNYILDRSN